MPTKKETKDTKKVAKKAPAKEVKKEIKKTVKAEPKAEVKKAPTKKVETKKVETSSQASGIFIPSNKTLKLSIGDKPYSRKTTQEDYETILPKIELYNKAKDGSKTKIALEKTLVDFMSVTTKKAEAVQEVLQTTKKAVEKRINKATKSEGTISKEEKDLISQLSSKFETGDVTDEEVKQLQALINKHKKVEEKAPTPVVTSTPRRGEH